MKSAYSKSIMASYATFKELYNSKKYHSPYQILSEFIKFIIASHSLFSFTSTDIQTLLNEEFGFNPPLAVIRTAMKSIPEVNRNNQTYQARGLQENTAFRKYRQQSENNSNILTNALLKYADDKGISNLNKKVLAQEFIAFVLDEEGLAPYQKLIGEFILTNEMNPTIKDTISAIREGSILFLGLAFNISEFGSLTQPLTLFLDTEILFDIVGLNGILFKNLADDFLKLVDVANRGGKVISLKFFSKVEEDIEQFYSRAESIISGHGEIQFSQAMKYIVDGCQSISDISDRKVELFRTLSYNNGINKDDKTNYYTESDNIYNLEGMNLEDYPTCDENAEGYLFCSHINKLRKGYQTTDYFSSKFLCVTDTRRVREISMAIAKSMKNTTTGEKYCDYAVSLSYITNLLWYKLNRGFGSTEFPHNLDVVIKARTILSSYITQGITLTYNDIKTKVSSGDLTAEQAAARIVALKEKTTLPENLKSDNIEDALNFSEEHFAQFEETISQNRRLLLERNKTIQELSDNLEDLKYQLAKALTKDAEKQKQIDQLTYRINTIDEQEKEKKRNMARWMGILKSISYLGIIALLLISIVIVFWIICKLFNIDFPTWLSIVISGVGLLLSIHPIIRNKLQQFRDKIR